MSISLSKPVATRAVQANTSTTITPLIVIFNLIQKQMVVTLAESDGNITIPLTDSEIALLLPRVTTFLNNHL